MERAWLMVIVPGYPFRGELIENREFVEIGYHNHMRFEPGGGSGEGEKPIRNRWSEHGLEVAIGKRELASQLPIERKLPFVIVSHRLGASPGAPAFRDDREAIVRTVIPCLEHGDPAVRQIVGRRRRNPM